MGDCHKLREAMALEGHDTPLYGDVEIDGCYVGGHVHPENRKEDRKDRRRVENQDKDRRVVVAMRERGGENRTLTFVEEREAAGVARAVDNVAPGATMHADEAGHWDGLHGYFRTTRINHSEMYSDDETGACTNQAESFFSRLRKMIGGQHHHVSPQPAPVCHALGMD